MGNLLTHTKISLKLDWATHTSAKFACENWHYSKSTPVPPLVKVGVWEDSRFIGVVIFSRGASSNLLKPYNLNTEEGCELTRVALAMHKAPVSRILALAFKFLKKNSPKLRLIVSFADPNEGHHGGIYQATNWIYAGVTAPTTKYVDKQGREWHSRQVSEKGYNVQQGNIRKTVRPSECIKIAQEGKHRYLLALDHLMKEQIAVLSKPYPKRAGSKANVVPADQAGEGGATPTPALQLNITEHEA